MFLSIPFLLFDLIYVLLQRQRGRCCVTNTSSQRNNQTESLAAWDGLLHISITVTKQQQKKNLLSIFNASSALCSARLFKTGIKERSSLSGNVSFSFFTTALSSFSFLCVLLLQLRNVCVAARSSRHCHQRCECKAKEQQQQQKKRLIPSLSHLFFFPLFLKEVHSSVSPSCSPIHTRPRTRPTPTARPRLHSSPTAATASSRHRHHSKAATHRPRTPTTHQRRLRRVAAMPSPARAPIPLHLGLFRRSHRCSRTCRRRRITYLAARATHRLLHR